jgi:hypothetical protein
MGLRDQHVRRLAVVRSDQFSRRQLWRTLAGAGIASFLLAVAIAVVDRGQTRHGLSDPGAFVFVWLDGWIVAAWFWMFGRWQWLAWRHSRRTNKRRGPQPLSRGSSKASK